MLPWPSILKIGSSMLVGVAVCIAWLNVLRQDKRAIFSAAAHAQRAVDYLHNLEVKQAQVA